MHDTSTESISKWRAVGAKRSQSMILSGGLSTQVKKQSRKYKPSKQRQRSSSKVFNRSRLGAQSMDNINKDDLNDSRSRIYESRVKEGLNLRGKKDFAIQDNKKEPIVRVNSVLQQPQVKEEKDKNLKGQKVNNYFVERQLITLKNDYTKFKQKMLTQLEIQKHNITKMINQILQSVKSQLLLIQEKYARNSIPLKRQQSTPIFPNFNLQTSPFKIKQHDLSTIKNISSVPISRNPTQKAIIAELSSGTNLQDPITERFSNFYLAIERLKSEINDLHQISSLDQTQTPNSSDSPLISQISSKNNNLSRFLKT